MQLNVKFSDFNYFKQPHRDNNYEEVKYIFMDFLAYQFAEWDIGQAFKFDTFKVDWEKEKVSIKFVIQK